MQVSRATVTNTITQLVSTIILRQVLTDQTKLRKSRLEYKNYSLTTFLRLEIDHKEYYASKYPCNCFGDKQK